MNKILKRLLSVVLAVMMVIGLVPLSGVKKVDAASADGAANMTVYLQITDDWAKDNAAFRAYLWETDWSSSDPDGTYYKPFEPVSGETNLYSVTLNNMSCYRIKVARCTSDYNTEWNSFRLNFYDRDNESVNKILVTGGNSGRWDGTYTPPGTGGDIPTDGIFYVNTDLVDYFNDSRVESGTTGYSADNQGNALGDMMGQEKVVPFSYFNGAISNLQQNNKYKFPLYFGALLFTNNRVGRTTRETSYQGNLQKWNSTVNIALANPNPDNEKDTNLDASVQGLVDDTLGSNGELKSNGQELPYFSKRSASSLTVSGKKVMEYYEGFRFPFKSEYNGETGVTKYSYDSATDYAVYRNWDNTNDRVLKMSTQTIKNTDGTNGYYPLNKEGESGSAVNYGFGTKFTIPFTINENGTVDGTAGGDPVTFSFTGDDDVWVFLDGKLILDMGGAHAKSTGIINFKDLTATVDDAATAVNNNSQVLPSGATNVLESYQNRGLENWVWGLEGDEKWGAQERSTVSTSSKTLNFRQYGDNYANSFRNSENTHTLVMFYMERGMYDSNMKIEFTINPLPSGLSLSKSLNVADVNTGLVSAVQAAESDSFNFKIQTKDLTSGNSEESYSDVADLGYSLNNYNNQDTSREAINSIITGVGSRSYAHSFINTGTKRDAFKGGTSFQITEKTDSNTVFEYDYEKTTWTVYDKENDNAVVASYSGTDDNQDNDNRLLAQFDMGTRESTEFERYDYAVNFSNTPKVGNLSLRKTWNDGQTAPENGEYPFTVLIDLDGESGNEFKYSEYALDGDIADTDTSGNITLQANQTVTFKGIPVGASYKITENIPADANYTSDKEDDIVTGTIGEDSVASVTFTNSFKTEELNKVIYIEAGRKDGTNYTLKDSDDANITITDIGSVDGITAVQNDEGTVNFKSDNADMKYEVSYSGTKTDGTIVTGTITVFTYKATNKVYVFDYGLESDLTETNDNGDGLFQGGVFYNANATGDNATMAALEKDGVIADEYNSQTSIIADDSVTINDNNGTTKGSVTFKPTAFMDKIENYTYKADIIKKGATLDMDNPETGTVVNGSIKVMPASTVYYEDNFAESGLEIKYTGTVKQVKSQMNSGIYGTDSAGNYIDEIVSDDLTVDLPEQSNDQSEQYGHDDAYSQGTKFSGGTSTRMSPGSTATFTFKGTGFDIISRTNTKTGSILVTVENADGTVKTIPLITYYDDGDLYQVPVIHEVGDDYDEYTVTIKVMNFEGQGNDIYFYLDGIRIYAPLEDDEDGYIASEVLATDKEIRPFILGSTVNNEPDRIALCQYEEGGSVYISNMKDGETFVEKLDNKGDTTLATGSLEDYWKFGPNNELYLEPGNAIAFLIPKDEYDSNLEEGYSTLQVAAKLENGNGVTLRAIGTNGAEIPLTTTRDNKSVNVDKISTATTMYYNVPVNNQMVVNVNNNGENKQYYQIIIANTSTESSERVALTNIKYAVAPELPDDSNVRTSIGKSFASVFGTEDGSINSAMFSGKVLKGKTATIQVYTSLNVDNVNVYDSDGNLLDLEWTSSTKTMNNDTKLKFWKAKLTAPKKAGKYTYKVTGQIGTKEISEVAEAVLTVK